MRTIWKMPIPIGDSIVERVPKGARILTTQMQGSAAMIWFICESAEPNVRRRFEWRGTGHNVGEAEQGAYIGTVQVPISYSKDVLVFHLFDLGEVL